VGNSHAAKTKICPKNAQWRKPMAAVKTVHQGDNLQQAIDGASPGDTFILDAGAEFGSAAPLLLPALPGNCAPVTIQSSAVGSQSTFPGGLQFPSDGVRVGPEDAPIMPKILSAGSGSAALQTSPGAHHFIFVGVEFKSRSESDAINTLINLGDAVSQTTLDQVPHHLVLDRCLIRAWPNQELKRGIGLNSAATDIVNCHVSGFKSTGQDSQAIAGWNGPGPFRILNCYLEGAGENVLFGGSATLIHGLIPSDIEIRNNLFSKPLTWNPKHPTYAGKQWAIKNLFELKNAQRVTITDNRFENCWVAAQQGYAILLTPRGDQSGGPWVTVADVEFARNVVANAAQGISMLGSDDSSPSDSLRNIAIRYMFFDDVATRNALWGDADGPPRLLSLSPGNSGGANGLTIEHNIATGGAVILFAEGQHTGLVFTNNLVPNGGIWDSSQRL
jgi:hypothetical protein